MAKKKLKIDVDSPEKIRDWIETIDELVDITKKDTDAAYWVELSAGIAELREELDILSGSKKLTTENTKEQKEYRKIVDGISQELFEAMVDSPTQDSNRRFEIRYEAMEFALSAIDYVIKNEVKIK